MRDGSREWRYAVDLTANGALREENGTLLEVPQDWSPEHLLLAALARCTLKSLRHHCERAGLEIGGASAGARGVVSRRETDGRYAMVQADVELAVEIEPPPGRDELRDLLAKAERDCFVGASLTFAPRYRWTINGRPARA